MEATGSPPSERCVGTAETSAAAISMQMIKATARVKGCLKLKVPVAMPMHQLFFSSRIGERPSSMIIAVLLPGFPLYKYNLFNVETRQIWIHLVFFF